MVLQVILRAFYADGSGWQRDFTSESEATKFAEAVIEVTRQPVRIEMFAMRLSGVFAN